MPSLKDAFFFARRVLHLSVVHDQVEALSYLLDVISTMEERRAILDIRNKQQQTALHLATLTDNVDAVIVSFLPWSC